MVRQLRQVASRHAPRLALILGLEHLLPGQRAARPGLDDIDLPALVT